MATVGQLGAVDELRREFQSTIGCLCLCIHWDIYSQIDQFPAGAFGKMPCTQYFNDFKNQVKYIVSSPYGYVDFLLYGGWITEKDARAEMSMSPDAWKKGQAAGRKAVSFMQLRLKGEMPGGPSPGGSPSGPARKIRKRKRFGEFD